MATEKMFTCVGITTHSRAGITVTKVRFGTDHIRLIKMLSSNKKISVSKHPDDRGDGFLDAVRVDIIELPTSMQKSDALKYLALHPDFQNAEDQALIAEEQDKREPKAPRVKKQKQVKVKGNIDSITNRAKQKLTAEELLAAAFAEEPIQE